MAVWEARHGERDNSGFARVNTALIRRAPLTIPNLGSFADGAGPVTAANGQVFIGNEQGRLFAFEANGTPLWHRDLGGGFVIRTSPVVGTTAQGHFTVYVLGTHTFRDHTVSPTVTRAEAKLFAFTETGALRWDVALPFDGVREFRPAAPSILTRGPSGNGIDAVILTLTFVSNPYPGLHTRLIVVSPEGVLAAKDVSSLISEVGTALEPIWVPLLPGFHINTNPQPVWERPVVLPAPGAAIERSGEPGIWVTDGFKNLVFYTLNGFTFTEVERFEFSDGSTLSSPVMIDQNDNQSLKRVFYSVGGELRSTTLHGGTKMIAEKQGGTACPTHLGNGVTLFTKASADRQFPSRLVVVKNDAVVSETALPSQTIVQAAASLNHIFVSTADYFLQFDPFMQKVGEVPWVNGGRIGPVIGRDGSVYAMASNILFIFPPMQNTGPVGGAHDTTHRPIGTGGNAGGGGRLG